MKVSIHKRGNDKDVANSAANQVVDFTTLRLSEFSAPNMLKPA